MADGDIITNNASDEEVLDDDVDMEEEAENAVDEAADGEEQANLSEAMLDAILQCMGGNTKEGLPTSGIGYSFEDNETEQFNRDKEDATRQCDLLFDAWKNDPLSFNSDLLCDPSDNSLASDRFKWIKIGALCWAKHRSYDWWPAIIKAFKKAKGARAVNQQATATVIFLEPSYSHFLHYKKQGVRLGLPRVKQFISMDPPDGSMKRPEDQIKRSQHSWLTCKKFLDFTFFEISERMGVLCERKSDKIMSGDQKSPRLDLDLLEGLFWHATNEWLLLNGCLRGNLPKDLPSSLHWDDLLPVLRNLSYWHQETSELPGLQQKKQADPDDDLEEEEQEGCYGYDFIQVDARRDQLELDYSDASRKKVDQREKYGEELLTVIYSRECKDRLRALRDSPANSFDNTERTRAWKGNNFRRLMELSANSSTGPIVVDSQVYKLYRFLRCLRRTNDKDNLKFWRACQDVWLPEALVYAIARVKDVTTEVAETLYMVGPEFVEEEIEKHWNDSPTISMAQAIHQKST